MRGDALLPHDPRRFYEKVPEFGRMAERLRQMTLVPTLTTYYASIAIGMMALEALEEGR